MHVHILHVHMYIYTHKSTHISHVYICTALHLAASEGHVELVKFLLERQADVNITDRMGFSPLVDALRHDQSTGNMKAGLFLLHTRTDL